LARSFSDTKERPGTLLDLTRNFQFIDPNELSAEPLWSPSAAQIWVPKCSLWVIAKKEPSSVRQANDDSFGLLPWIGALLTAMAFLIATFVATH
jgi:hypothetical protein